MKMPRALRNFIIGYLLLHIVVTILVVWGLTRSVRSMMIDDARERLNAMAIMLNEHVNEQDDGLSAARLPDFLNRLETTLTFVLR